MSCTRRGFLTTLGAALAGLGLVGLQPLRVFARGPEGNGDPIVGGPASGPFSAQALRAWAVDTARWLGDEDLANFLGEVCCWAPAATEIRTRPQDTQLRGAHRLFEPFPNGSELAEIAWLVLNTSWSAPTLRFDAEEEVDHYYRSRGRRGRPARVVSPSSALGPSNVALVLDRNTGERLGEADDRSEPMWAAFSMLSGAMLDPADELNRRMARGLSLDRRADRALARAAPIAYTQIIFGAAQRAIWADLLGGSNHALPLVRLTAAGLLPMGEQDGSFALVQLGETGAADSARPRNE